MHEAMKLRVVCRGDGRDCRHSGRERANKATIRLMEMSGLGGTSAARRILVGTDLVLWAGTTSLCAMFDPRSASIAIGNLLLSVKAKESLAGIVKHISIFTQPRQLLHE